MPQDPFSLNVAGVQNLIESKTNKAMADGATSITEGAESERYDVLELPMSDEKLLKLATEWEKAYAPYETSYTLIPERNLESYLGKRKNGQWLVDNGPLAANQQFPAMETFLSAALAKNPEPYVYASNDQQGNAISNAVKTMLQFHADQLVIRRKLAFMVRQWGIFHLGVLKAGWNKRLDYDGNDIGDVSIENRKIEDFIFDPNGYVDAYGDFIGHLGERRTEKAEVLIDMYPKHKEYIDFEVDGKLGTECKFTEWWTDEYSFVSFKRVVLDKFKNPNYRYPEPQKDGAGTHITDVFGEKQMTKPRNHFAQPKKPYIFLSVYSLQNQPHDITGNVEQNIPNQNSITRQTEQIDYNVGASNNGYAYSEDNFNQETAKQASNARRKGNPILIPSGGPIDRAIYPLPAQNLPPAFFESLKNHKEDILFSWGVQGIAAQAPTEDTTARGMILNQSHDTTRIGGGIGDAIEQVADNVFNWLTQLYYVNYDEPHFAAVMGNAKAVEYIQLSNQDLNQQLIVGVAPDSMKPKDDITQINLAQALFDKGAIGPKTLLKMVDFPDVDEAAADGVLWQIDKMAYFKMNFPEEFAAMQQASPQQPAGAPGPAPAGGAPLPQAQGGPPPTTAAEPASAALSQVQLPPEGVTQ